MPIGIKEPAFGYKPCLVCENLVKLKIQRDVLRKKYCSNECRLNGAIVLMKRAAEQIKSELKGVDVRRCKSCLSDYPKTIQFFNFSKSKDGKFHISAYCKTCRNFINKTSSIKKYGTIRNRGYLKRYGLTELQVDEMIKSNGGICIICNKRKNQVVDHDHSTGIVRGVICSGCNTSIGVFGESLEVLERVKEYLNGTLR